MSRNNLLIRVLAAIGGIVAVALVAATIDSPLETGGSGGSAPGSGNGDGGGDPIEQPPPPEDPATAPEIPTFLEYLIYAIVIIGVIAAVWYLLANRREAVKLIAIGLVMALIGMALVYLFLEAGDPSLADEMIPGDENGEPAAPGSGDGERTDLVPTNALVAVLAIITAIFVAGVFLTRGSGEETEPGAVAPPEDEGQQQNEDALAVGSAAGRAADRLDDTDDVDNEIYRAWREMTQPLDVDRPESSTPGEFATAAIDAGLDRQHVDELTHLFEDVRYGTTETTPELEKRAVSILREIEVTYGDDSADTHSASQQVGPSDHPGGDST
ncbi:hypothetical protein C500_02509 [Natrialba magadii ATCC 43099]|uniref:Protein-glutamine gamma-glutamyltransferase-like C-terminal domain-containing protein n=1 Tax=Natrialba magadii (strain ATCC 43099 / DSM 3394 / CCM 3739 / CIP 104546 / IAM 13178 / JCM 8861 / NBRC 102185 / NCIMB 2190 / MS3) TaxID=547559 RepID=L9V7V9_NATMM|nr:DUF4129 domain-containing protein [Natrialba magadii]ELY33164.1 hypothetical protein C500_02509 [Natrialba magadii ATCC 43099]